jgi:hypothetical protein
MRDLARPAATAFGSPPGPIQLSALLSPYGLGARQTSPSRPPKGANHGPHGLFPCITRAKRDGQHHVRRCRALAAAYDFGRFGTVVDIGGGNGALLSALLQRYPRMRGVVFDQPAVVERAKQFLRASGAADRCRLVGGSFFESVPEGGTLTSSSTSPTTGKTRTRREFCRSFVARFRTAALSC